ncbi:MAG: hypothetical protein DDT22_00118 [candidate division WS2 bacterium]|nr:hypothetical protein [Candidatus Lithacetigena glycinireducens]
MKRRDLLIYLFSASMLLFSFLLYLFLYSGLGFDQHIESVVVEYKKQVYAKIPLPSPERTIDINGPWGVIMLDLNGYKVRVNPFSPPYCPDKICMKQGWISKPPETIVCLPNRIIIYYQGGKYIDGLTH